MPGHRAISGTVSRGLGAYTGGQIVDLIENGKCKNIWNSSFVNRTINNIKVNGTIRNPNSQGSVSGYVQVKFNDLNLGSQAFTLGPNATRSFSIASANPLSNVTAVSKLTILYSKVYPLNAGVTITAEVIYPTITQYDLISDGAMEMAFLRNCGFAALGYVGTSHTISHNTHFSGIHQSIVLSEGQVVSISTLNTIYNDISGSNLFTGVTK